MAHRQKKKTENKQIEQELEKLRKENARLLSENDTLHSENSNLKIEVSAIKKKFENLRDLLKQTGTVSLQALQKFGEYSIVVNTETKKKAIGSFMVRKFSFIFNSTGKFYYLLLIRFSYFLLVFYLTLLLMFPSFLLTLLLIILLLLLHLLPLLILDNFLKFLWIPINL